MIDMSPFAEVKPGYRARHPHDCGGGDVLMVSYGDSGVSAFCFRCGDRGFVPHGKQSLSELLAIQQRRAAGEHVAVRTTSLPEPQNHDVPSWPLSAKVWLYKAGMSLSEIAQLGAYYHEPTGRVVLPAKNKDGDVTYWQARSPEWVRGSKFAKYLNPTGVQPTGAWFGSGDTVVLTEDILSAFRVHRAGFPACGLLGTKVNNVVMAELMKFTKVYIMLDSDGAGQDGARKIKQSLELTGVSTILVQSDRDPKLLTHRQIQELLRD